MIAMDMMLLTMTGAAIGMVVVVFIMLPARAMIGRLIEAIPKQVYCKHLWTKTVKRLGKRHSGDTSARKMGNDKIEAHTCPLKTTTS